MSETGMLPSLTTRYECPIGACPWIHDDQGPSGTVTSDADLSVLLRDHMLAAESVVKAHLETHSLLEWVQEVMRLRLQAAGTVAVSREDLDTVYTYARHFDVACDEAMIRVKGALGL